MRVNWSRPNLLGGNALKWACLSGFSSHTFERECNRTSIPLCKFLFGGSYSLRSLRLFRTYARNNVSKLFIILNEGISIRVTFIITALIIATTLQKSTLFFICVMVFFVFKRCRYLIASVSQAFFH